MTTKDLRDIAAYWDSEYSVPNSAEKSGISFHAVDEELFSWIKNVGPIPSFKLHLRQISSLTDDELKQCYVEDEYQTTKIDSVDWWSIRRYDDKICVSGLCLSFTGKFYRVTPAFPDGDMGPLRWPGKLITYLQSIGVYVPGCIDEKYVTLI